MSDASGPPARDGEHAVVLVGNPNVGKSVLFGALTGRYVEVSNYPGTTVEVCAGRTDGVRLLDTPGIQSLHARSDEERVTRDILLRHPRGAVVQVADARNLRRSLLLTVQLAELGRPFVLDVNMMDEARGRGFAVDVERLAQLLGAEVVATVAVRGEGVSHLRTRLREARPMVHRIRYDGAIEDAVARILPLVPAGLPEGRAVALMILAGDEALAARFAGERRAEVAAIVSETAARYAGPLSYELTRQRMRCVDCFVDQVVSRVARPPHSRGDALGRLALHPVWGWFLLVAVLAVVYLFVGQLGAGVLVDWMQSVVFGRGVNPFATRLAGLLPFPFVRDLLVGEYGLVTMALSYGIAIVMPIVLTFFLVFGLLEDSGYLPRLAVMMDRPFKAMGLNGKAVLPMVLGLGCDTMATLTTRILETRKDRLLVTLLLALGVPCSAQLGVILGMIAYLPPAAVAVWGGVVAAVMFTVGWAAARVIPGERSDFILELPPIRVPQVANILVKTVARLEWYLKEVLPLFAVGTLVLFALDRSGSLVALERWAAPLVQDGLGLPRETTAAFIVGFLRRDYGAAGLFNLARAGALAVPQLVVSLVVVTLFVPCVANVLVIAREHGARAAVWVVAFVFPFAFGVGMLLHLAFRVLGVTF
ncbi:MAG: ferrous iron transport protein B [Candidatus Eisenbacteria bacterium]|nr:ferrous iron transport protein B [Candidatus Eisenbacteria bacterium]